MKKKFLIAAAVLALAFVVMPQDRNAVMSVDAATKTATSSTVITNAIESVMDNSSMTTAEKLEAIEAVAGTPYQFAQNIVENYDQDVVDALAELEGTPVTVTSSVEGIDSSEVTVVGAALNGASTLTIEAAEPSSATVRYISCKGLSEEEANAAVNQAADAFCLEMKLDVSKSFDVPVVITIPVPEGIDGSKAVFLHYGSEWTASESDAYWDSTLVAGETYVSVEVIKPVYDASANTLTIALSHFSKFAIVGSASTDSDSSDDSSSSSDSSDSSSAGSCSTSENDPTIFEKLATEVENAEDGAVITITRDMNINALPNNIMQTLYQKKTVTLVMEYTYNGVNYTATIAAGKAINSDIAWYGPLYLQAYYGNGVTVAATGAGTYTIKSGDTLSKIAKANGMKLSTLQQLNAEIAAQKYIYPGQVLKLK